MKLRLFLVGAIAASVTLLNVQCNCGGDEGPTCAPAPTITGWNFPTAKVPYGVGTQSLGVTFSRSINNITSSDVLIQAYSGSPTTTATLSNFTTTDNTVWNFTASGLSDGACYYVTFQNSVSAGSGECVRNLATPLSSPNDYRNSFCVDICNFYEFTEGNLRFALIDTSVTPEVETPVTGTLDMSQANLLPKYDLWPTSTSSYKTYGAYIMQAITNGECEWTSTTCNGGEATTDVRYTAWIQDINGALDPDNGQFIDGNPWCFGDNTSGYTVASNAADDLGGAMPVWREYTATGDRVFAPSLTPYDRNGNGDYDDNGDGEYDEEWAMGADFEGIDFDEKQYFRLWLGNLSNNTIGPLSGHANGYGTLGDPDIELDVTPGANFNRFEIFAVSEEETNPVTKMPYCMTFRGGSTFASFLGLTAGPTSALNDANRAGISAALFKNTSTIVGHVAAGTAAPSLPSGTGLVSHLITRYSTLDDTSSTAPNYWAVTTSLLAPVYQNLADGSTNYLLKNLWQADPGIGRNSVSYKTKLFLDSTDTYYVRCSPGEGYVLNGGTPAITMTPSAPFRYAVTFAVTQQAGTQLGWAGASVPYAADVQDAVTNPTDYAGTSWLCDALGTPIVTGNGTSTGNCINTDIGATYTVDLAPATYPASTTYYMQFLSANDVHWFIVKDI